MRQAPYRGPESRTARLQIEFRRAKNLDDIGCCMAAFVHRITASFSERRMMRMTTINQPTWRLASGSCIAHGIGRLVVKDGTSSGRTTE